MCGCLGGCLREKDKDCFKISFFASFHSVWKVLDETLRDHM